MNFYIDREKVQQRFLWLGFLLLASCGPTCNYLWRDVLCVVENGQNPNRGLVDYALTTTELLVNQNSPGLSLTNTLEDKTLEFIDGWAAHTLDFETMEVGAEAVCSWVYQSVAHEALHIIAKEHYGLGLNLNKKHWPSGPVFDSADQDDPARVNTIEYKEEVAMVEECKRLGLQE